MRSEPVSRAFARRRSGFARRARSVPWARIERLAADDRAVALVHRRRDDQVHLAVLVLEQHEDDAVRGRGPLSGDGHPRHGHLSAVRCQRTAHGWRGRRREMRAQELHRVHADREARLAVVGEHPLPVGLLRKLGRLGGRVERQRELALLAAASRARLASAGRGRAPRAARAASRRASRRRRRRSSALEPPRPSDVRCASETTSSNGPPRPAPATSALASSSPTDAMYSRPIRTAPSSIEQLRLAHG